MKTLKKSLLIAASVTVALSTLAAEPFHRYKVKSGKIVYEHKMFKIKRGFRVVNGKSESINEIIPYVTTRNTYYWDNYGDVAFEQAWQVSGTFGKPLPEPVKLFEQLWKGDKRPYYNFKEKRKSIDDWHEKEICLPKVKTLDERGCFGVMYPKMELIGEEVVAAQKAQSYRDGVGTDLYLWNGLKLKQQDYRTDSGSTKRYDIFREIVAVEIDTNTTINPEIFNPQWLDKAK